MKTYSVRQIADLLGTNPETVRRWIRSGKLNAVQGSRKDGNAVSEDELSKFLKATPKYASIAGKSLIGTPIGLPVAVGGLIGSLMVEYFDSQKHAKNARVRPEDITKYLNENITSHEEAIKRKNKAIEQLQEEITEELRQIEALRKTIETLNQHKEE